MPVAIEIQRSPRDALLGVETLPQSVSEGWQGMFSHQCTEINSKAKSLKSIALKGGLPRGLKVGGIENPSYKGTSIVFNPSADELAQAPLPLKMLFRDLGITTEDTVEAELTLNIPKDVIGGRFLPALRIKPTEISQTKAGVEMRMVKDSSVYADPISTTKTERGTRVNVFGGERILTRYQVPSGKGEEIQDFYGSQRSNVHAVKRIILESAMDWVKDLQTPKGFTRAEYGWIDLNRSMAQAVNDLREPTRDLLHELTKRDGLSQEGFECLKLQGDKDAFLRLPLDKETISQAPESVRRVLVDLGIADEEKLFAEISSTWTDVVVGIRPEHAKNDKYGIWFTTDGNAKIDGPTSVIYHGIAGGNFSGFRSILRGRRHVGLENFYAGEMPRYLRNQVIADAVSWVTEIAESRLPQ